MLAFDEADLSLFGDWPDSCVYRHGVATDCDLEAAPEIKSAPVEDTTQDDLRQLLNALTAELREQCRMYQRMREVSEPLLSVAIDETPGKQGRADVKAATESLSVVVRTLEKIDVLQRQIAEERERNADRAEESEDYDAAVAFFLQRIDALAEQKAAAICAARGMSLDAAPEDAE
ncbi:hypothetical protein [Agrobacterium tumefaciens]|uniref:hypothetical protein n=1 Tax=Agrobacterium tumefaciens TaxID=358 RepID=UPI00287BDD35|nr:hypothetical protein [Agrobacterium tumefaciens]MDS7596535.1 hypothetical protein [Agrobacterium tumefaciens]